MKLSKRLRYSETTAVISSPSLVESNTSRKWFSTIFWLIAVGAPYILYRLLTKTKRVAYVVDSAQWMTGEYEYYEAVVRAYFFTFGGQITTICLLFFS